MRLILLCFTIFLSRCPVILRKTIEELNVFRGLFGSQIHHFISVTQQQVVLRGTFSDSKGSVN